MKHLFKPLLTLRESLHSQMIEFINTKKDQKTKSDKTYSWEDIIKIRHGFCHLHRIAESHSARNEIEAHF